MCGVCLNRGRVCGLSKEGMCVGCEEGMCVGCV